MSRSQEPEMGKARLITMAAAAIWRPESDRLRPLYLPMKRETEGGWARVWPFRKSLIMCPGFTPWGIGPRRAALASGEAGAGRSVQPLGVLGEQADEAP